MLDEDRADRARADAAAAFGHRNSLTTRQNLPAPRPPAARRRKPSRLPTGAAPGDGAPPRQRPRRQQEHRHPERQGGQPEPPPPADPPRLSTVDEQEQRPQPLHQHEDPDPPGHLHTQHRGGVGDAGDVPRPIHSHLRVPAVHQLTGVPVRDRQGRAVVVGHGGGRLRNTHRQLHLRVMPPRTPTPNSTAPPARRCRSIRGPARRRPAPGRPGPSRRRPAGRRGSPRAHPHSTVASRTSGVRSAGRPGTRPIPATRPGRRHRGRPRCPAPCETTAPEQPRGPLHGRRRTRLLVPSDVAPRPRQRGLDRLRTRPGALARRSRPRRSLAVRRTGRCRVTDARTTPAPGGSRAPRAEFHGRSPPSGQAR